MLVGGCGCIHVCVHAMQFDMMCGEATLMTTRSSDYCLMRADASRTWGWETSERKHTQGGGGKSRQFFYYSVSPSSEAKRVIHVQTLQATATEAE